MSNGSYHEVIHVSTGVYKVGKPLPAEAESEVLMDWADQKAEELIKQWDEAALVNPGEWACNRLAELLAVALREAEKRGEDRWHPDPNEPGRE